MLQVQLLHGGATLARVSLQTILLGLAAFTTSCSSASLLTRADYRPAVEAMGKEGPARAEELLPAGEAGSFIPTMERTYLALLQGRPEIDALRAYAARIDDRVRIRVSEELAFLFYVETPEGYFASEHEIIWMHMLLSWGYSLRHDTDSAIIEAKKAALLLEGKAKAGRFDDPMLRVILATLWVMCDRWEDARVDFRVAARLDPSLKWAGSLAEQPAPPGPLTLVLTGTGPEPAWKPEMRLNPIRGLRDLEFSPPGKDPPLAFFDASGRPLTSFRSPDSSRWYARHLERNNALHEVFDDSRYSQRLILSTTKGTLKAGGFITVGILLGTLSLGVGGAIVYYAHESQELASLGLAIMYFGTKGSYEFARDGVEESARVALDELDISDRYRYVRFLPDRARLIPNTGTAPLRVWTGKRMQTLDATPNAPGGASILYLPDPP